jgi:hypothetical protein
LNKRPETARKDRSKFVSRTFNYRAPAELFAPKGRPGPKQPVTYKRFPTAAAAIRYAIEELPQAGLAAAILEVEESRFDHAGIRALYESKAYPYRRAKPDVHR